MQHQIANRLNLWMTGNSVWCWMPHECVFPSWMPHGILGKTNATALMAFDTKTACLSWLLYKARFLLYCYGLHVVTGLHALQVEPPVLAPMPPFMVEKVGLLNYKMSYQVSFCTHCKCRHQTSKRGCGNVAGARAGDRTKRSRFYSETLWTIQAFTPDFRPSQFDIWLCQFRRWRVDLLPWLWICMQRPDADAFIFAQCVMPGRCSRRWNLYWTCCQNTWLVS